MSFGRPNVPPKDDSARPPEPLSPPDPGAVPGLDMPVQEGVLPAVAPIPRSLQPEMWLYLLLGTKLAIVGWALVVAGMILLVAMAPYTDVVGLFALPGSGATAEGVVQEVTETDWGDLELGSRDPVFANRFLYTPPGGNTLEVLSYSTGRVVEAGERVTVVYRPGNPYRARIQGQRYRPLGRLSSMLLLPALLGLFLAGRALITGMGHVRLLQRGRAALAALTQSKEICDRQGRPTHWLLDFSFSTPDGEIRYLTFQTRDTRPVEDDTREVVFYNPDLTGHGVLFDALPGRPLIDEQGAIQVSDPITAWMSVLPAALAILLTLATFWYLGSASF